MKVKYLIVPFFALYSFSVFFGATSSTLHSEQGEPNQTTPAVIATHIARDSGLRMQLLVKELPALYHRGHAIADVLLCFTMAFQKETVCSMDRSLSSRKDVKSYASQLFWHR